MNYNVNFKCGHSCFIDVPSKKAEREPFIEKMKNEICPTCKKEKINKENSLNCYELEVTHEEYQRNYPECKEKIGSYNAHTNTLIIYVPNEKGKI